MIALQLPRDVITHLPFLVLTGFRTSERRALQDFRVARNWLRHPLSPPVDFGSQIQRRTDHQAHTVCLIVRSDVVGLRAGIDIV
tara:strand:- start:835 stop:1086 length:252 start_codon:yes stop_codon:yes gene_type:complete